jgi:glutamate racemase
MACTHYSFIIPLIHELYGPALIVIDPAPAIARQTKRLHDQISKVLPSKNGITTFLSTADPNKLVDRAQSLVGVSGPSLSAHWNDNQVEINPQVTSP